MRTEIDKNEFFREVTLRLCRNLEIEEGLHSCMEYLSRFIPADRIYLERWESELSCMRIVARADPEKGELMDTLVPMDPTAEDELEEANKLYNEGKLPQVFIVNDSEKKPVTKHLLAALGEPPSSALSLPLIINQKMAGTLALLAEGVDRFTEGHAQLYATLKEPFFIAMSNTLKYRELLTLKDLLADSNQFLRSELRRISGDEIVGMNFGLKDVINQALRVAVLDSPVLLLGETGVGKDVIANAIHYSSPRQGKPFIKVNCGAIPESLVESELFGHEKGAFTGAVSMKRGYFERADKGTIFLDEVGELPLQTQVRLLGVLQDKQIQRVGGMKSIDLDIRIIAATNRDLQAMVDERDFREDLWFRLNVFPIVIPPLRERKIDIPAILQHFILLKTKELKLGMVPKLARGAIARLMDYNWPGNVRELANIVERALILNPAGPLEFADLLPAERIGGEKLKKARPNVLPRAELPIPAEVYPPEDEPPEDVVTLDELITMQIKKVLKKTDGKIHGPGGAAELLGLNPSTLRSRMKKLGIKYDPED